MGSVSSELRIETVTPLPEVIAVGGGTAVFVDGRCSWPDIDIERLVLTVDGTECPLMGWGLAPPGGRGDDYWWAIVGFDLCARARDAEIGLRATSIGGARAEGTLGRIELLPGLGPLPALARPEPEVPEGPMVAICMATYEPEIELFRAQIDSIRAQTHQNWICLISDDGSGGRALAAIHNEIAGDGRFVVDHSERNRGFYRNFERALQMVPPEADFVALSDQDDRWHPDKLERLVLGLEPGRRLVYSDMRITDRAGGVIAPSYWGFRRNNYTDLGSLLLANTVTGAASLFDAGLLADVLPFPPRHSAMFHDHWLAEVAFVLGGISYVDAPLHDYVQHDAAALGYLQANGFGRYSASLRERVGIWYGRWSDRGFRLGWRPPYFRVFCRVALSAEVLRRRFGSRLSSEDAATIDLIEDSPAGWVWLLRRAVRDIGGPTETIGRERVVLAGLAWRHGAELRKRVRRTRRRLTAPAGPPQPR